MSWPLNWPIGHLRWCAPPPLPPPEPGERYLPGRTVYALDELGLGAWVGLLDESMRMDLATRLVAPLDGCLDLVQTLEIFFAENATPIAAAARLAIHRNTLAYRLERVKQMTGLDPRHFDDAVQLRLALLLRQRASRADAQSAEGPGQSSLGN